MKTSRSLTLVLLAAMILSARVSGVTIIATDFVISGDWTEAWLDPSDDQTYSNHDNFGATSTAASASPPISVAVTSNPNGANTASSTIGSFNLNMRARSVPYDSSRPNGVISQSPTGIYISAMSTTRFRSDESHLTLTFGGLAGFNYEEDEQDMAVVLRDITTSTTLLSVASLDTLFGGPGDSYVSEFSLDSSHEYEWVMSAWIEAHDAKSASLSMEADLHDWSPGEVPESGASLIMLLISLPAAFLLRQRAARR